MRLRARTDANHARIGRLFRSLGCSTLDISTLGKGCGDWLIGLCAHNIIVEVKDGEKPPSARKLTDAETEFHETWKGTVVIVETDEDAINLVNAVRGGAWKRS